MRALRIAALLALIGLPVAAEPEIRLLPVPDVRQSTIYSCGASALQAVLMYYGEEFREDELMRRLGTDCDDGTTPAAMIALAREMGYQAELKEELALSDLEASLARGVPVIVAAQAWRETELPDWSERWDDGHYLVVIGMDRTNVYFEDPSLLGSRGLIPKGEFESRWHDVEADGRRYRGLGLFIWGKAPQPPPAFLHVE